MRVLQVSCDGLGNGGIQSVIMNISKYTLDVQFDILLFTNETRYYDKEFEKLGGKIFRIPNYEGKNKYRRKLDYYVRFARIFYQTYKLIKREGSYDAIHCHNDLESGICNLAAFFAGINIRISHAHTSHSKFPKYNIVAYIYRKILQKLMNLSTNRKIGCTKEAFYSIFGEKHIKKTNAYVIPNPIELDKFSKENPYMTNQNKSNIIHVGRYDENKNQLFIVELLPYIIPYIPNVRLKLLGSGCDYERKLLKRVSELNLEFYVEFLSPNSDVKEVLEDASLFILPSKHEGFGIVLIEAQSMEVSCLVSDTVPKIIDCGLCEFLSLSNSKQVWANHAINLLKNKDKKKLDKKKLSYFDVGKYTSFMKKLYGGQEYESWNTYFSQSQ